MPEVELSVTGGSCVTVAYILEEDGGLTLVRECRMGSIIVPLEGSCQLLIADNDKQFSDVRRMHGTMTRCALPRPGRFLTA